MSSLKSKLFTKMVLSAKAYNEKHKNHAKQVTYLTLGLITFLSIILYIPEKICAAVAWVVRLLWKKRVITVAVLVIAIAVSLVWRITTTDKKESPAGQETEIVTSENNEATNDSGNESEVVEADVTEAEPETEDVAEAEAETGESLETEAAEGTGESEVADNEKSETVDGKAETEKTDSQTKTEETVAAGQTKTENNENSQKSSQTEESKTTGSEQSTTSAGTTTADSGKRDSASATTGTTANSEAATAGTTANSEATTSSEAAADSEEANTSSETETTTESASTEPAANDSATTETATASEGTQTTMPGADINVPELASFLEQYPEAVGWIYMEGGEISYPIMHCDNNEKYLTTDFEGKPAEAGSIFLDSRSAADFTDSNSIIYGHNMKDKTMFGNLRRYREDPNYYTNNQYFAILAGNKVYKYKIFAYMDVPKDYEIYNYVGEASKAFVANAEPVRLKSYMDSEYPVNADSKVVTLSTCSDCDELRFVILGVLVQE